MTKVAFTMVRDEKILLPLWLKYYSRYFKDIYVLGHNSTDGSIEKCQKEFKFIRHDMGDHPKLDYIKHRVEFVKNYQEKLLKEYEWVLFTDVDEFIIANPEKYSGLDDYIDKIKGDYVTCTGGEVLQLPEEKAIDWEKPLLVQRSTWWPHIAYYKTVISKVPLDWVDGFHYTNEIFKNSEGHKDGLGGYIKEIADPDLVMVHLKQIDKSLFERKSSPKSEPGEKIKIPEKWKGVF